MYISLVIDYKRSLQWQSKAKYLQTPKLKQMSSTFAFQPS